MVLTRAQRRNLKEESESISNTVRNSNTENTEGFRKFSGITVSTWNIVDGRGNRLELACNCLARLNIDIALLTETKLNGQHTVNSYGYSVFSTKCKNQHQGGVTLVHKTSKFWHIESPASYGDNVLKCTLVHGKKHTTIVGVYFPPSEESMETLTNLDLALNNVNVENLVILGDFNVNFEHPKDTRSLHIVETIQTFGLKNLAKEFKPRRNKCFNWSWRKMREGEKLQSLCDYFFHGSNTNWKSFNMIDVTTFDSDHRLLKGKLTPAATKKYRKYVKERSTPPVELFALDSTDGPFETDKRIKELQDALVEEKRDKKDRSWISENSFSLLRKKATALRRGAPATKDIGRELRRSLRQDRRKRIQRTAEEIEAKLADGDIIEAFAILRHWYRKFTGRALKPCHADLERTRETYVQLFTDDDLSDEQPLDFEYEGNEVKDEIPDGEEIKCALFKMRSRKAPGLTRISVDDLKLWYRAAHPENEDSTTNPVDRDRWNSVIKIVQDCFKGIIPTAFTIGVLVIIPKDDKGGVRGIGLLETIHKLVSQIINIRMGNTIKFCEEVHGFRRKRGCFTAIGETKLQMQIAACQSDTIYQVYLDLRKAYDSIARNRVVKLLEKYKVGPNIRKYIYEIWDKQTFVLRQAGFYSGKIDVSRGCTQGDVDSPIIFNIIVDAVLRTWKSSENYRQSSACFYADDGLLQHHDHVALQNDLDRMIELFGKFGLKPNASKTKFMIFRGAPAPRAKTQIEYNKMIRTRNNTSFAATGEERRKLKTNCPICGQILTNASLKRHMDSKHPTNNNNKYVCREAKDKGAYTMTFRKGKVNKCPVPQCIGGGRDKFGIYRHFCLIHPEANIVIEEDGVLPKCQICGMRVSGDLDKHQNSFTCKLGASRRRNETKQDRQFEAENVKFHIGGEELERVRYFKYLGRILTEDDDDTRCIENNLKKARQQWNSIAKILKKEGASAKCMAKFYITVVQAVLLYGADSWTISQRNERKLISFHRRAVRYLTDSHIRKLDNGKWVHPNHEPLFRKCGLFPINVYLERRRGTLRRYLETFKEDLLQKAESCTRHCLNVQKVLWWKQPYLLKEDIDHSDFWRE